MRLDAKGISKYVMESFENDPKGWKKPPLCSISERRLSHKGINVSVTNHHGYMLICKDAEQVYNRVWLRLSLIDSSKLYYSYLKHIKKVPTWLIVLRGTLAWGLVIPKVIQLMVKRSEDRYLVKSGARRFDVELNFKIEKSYLRELRFRKLLDK